MPCPTDGKQNLAANEGRSEDAFWRRKSAREEEGTGGNAAGLQGGCTLWHARCKRMTGLKSWLVNSACTVTVQTCHTDQTVPRPASVSFYGSWWLIGEGPWDCHRPACFKTTAATASTFAFFACTFASCLSGLIKRKAGRSWKLLRYPENVGEMSVSTFCALKIFIHFLQTPVSLCHPGGPTVAQRGAFCRRLARLRTCMLARAQLEPATDDTLPHPTAATTSCGHNQEEIENASPLPVKTQTEAISAYN